MARRPGRLHLALHYKTLAIVLTGEDLPNSPRQLAKVNLSIPLVQKKLFASVDAQYTSRTRTVAQTELGGFFVVNLTVFSRKITEKIDFSGGLYNLLDKRYADSGGLEHRGSLDSSRWTKLSDQADLSASCGFEIGRNRNNPFD